MTEDAQGSGVQSVNNTQESSAQGTDLQEENSTSRAKTRSIAVLLVAAALAWVMVGEGFGLSSIGILLPVITTAAIYAIAAVGLNLQFGHGGMLNFGFVAFMVSGAYITVSLIPHLQGPQSASHEGEVPLVLAVLAAMIATSVLGALFALPAIRLRSHYFAIAMIALAEILRILMKTFEPVTGGVYGMLGYGQAFHDLRPQVLTSIADALSANASALWLAIVCWACLLLCVLAIAGLMRTPWGKLLRAVGDDEYAVRSLGKNPVAIKAQALMIGSAIGGLSGALLAFQLSQINPDVFLPEVTFYVFTIVILGGTASTWGPVVGSVLFWILLSQSGAFISEYVGSNTAAAASRYILVGTVMALLIVFRPQGILGRREDVTLDLR